MARRYSGARGKSGSKKPSVKTEAKWVTQKPAEIETLIVQFAKDKMTASMIGLKLRDSYGIPSVQAITGHSITEILEKHKAGKSIPQALIDAIVKAIKVKKHLDANKQDKAALRGLTLANSRINRLAKYYKETGKLEANWKFDPDIAGMYLE